MYNINRRLKKRKKKKDTLIIMINRFRNVRYSFNFFLKHFCFLFHSIHENALNFLSLVISLTHGPVNLVYGQLSFTWVTIFDIWAPVFAVQVHRIWDILFI